MVYKTKSEKITIPLGNMMLIAISYKIILIIGGSILLGVFRIGDEVIRDFGVYYKYVECRFDEDFMVYDRHES